MPFASAFLSTRNGNCAWAGDCGPDSHGLPNRSGDEQVHGEGLGAERAAPTRQQGVVLLVALLVLALLVTIALQFTYTTTIDLKLVRNQSRELRSYYAARGVVALARAHLLDDLVQDGGMFAADSYNDGWARGDAEEAGGTLDFTRGGIFRKSISGVDLEYEILDEDRKICVNNLAVEELYLPPPGQAESPLETLEPSDEEGAAERPDPKALAKERREMTRKFIREILVRLNLGSDDAERLVAAMEESAPYASIEELAKIDGVTPEILHGHRDEFGRTPGLVDYLTVYSMGEININTASREVLVAILSEKYGQDAAFHADAVLDFRSPPEDEEAFKEPAEEEEHDREDEEKVPAGFFTAVDELSRRIPGLEDLFGEPGEEDKEGQKQGKKLKRQLTIWSRFFSVRVTAGETAPRKEYTFVLKRGLTPEAPIPLLIWEERELPPVIPERSTGGARSR